MLAEKAVRNSKKITGKTTKVVAKIGVMWLIPKKSTKGTIQTITGDVCISKIEGTNNFEEVLCGLRKKDKSKPKIKDKKNAIMERLLV